MTIGSRFGLLLGLGAALTYADTAIAVNLGTVAPFAVIGGSTVTNTGATVVTGNLGVWPGTAVTGFPPGILNGTLEDSDAVAQQAQSDLTVAYNFAAGEACGTTLTGQDLGGMTLTPGVYCFASSAQLTGTLTLDALGNSNAVFLFQIGSTLTTSSGASVDFTNGGQGSNVFWQVGSSATLGTTTSFEGTILALTDITLNTAADIPCGRALARNGQVTMDTNQLDASGCDLGVTTPESPTVALVGGGGLLGWIVLCWKRRTRKIACHC